ncbi:cystathionine beta-lyase [Fodinicurvata sp. EGI_FJ10296]|uniref:cystathionine beta-lyase n=1 Tax=Fodinicurvata sp. EGI_FJ10296 TaxID=3231908 RepID=UPI0034522048
MKNHRTKTILTHAGRDPRSNYGIVNPPVYHASTILFPDIESMEESAKRPFDGYRYGRSGTPTTTAFEQAVTALEGGHRSVAVSSGLAAITVAIGAFVRAGDHLLVPDSAYPPTKAYCDKVLGRYGVETTYYDPEIGAGIGDLIASNTRMIVLESPGSQTFEVQDVPAISATARDRGVVTMIDNTWATPLFFRPFDHGVDLSVHAATKYMVGHADAMMGVICTNSEEHFRAVKTECYLLGHSAGPDDLYLAQRGLRSMAARLAQHQTSALQIAQWLETRPEVAQVLYPALPSHPGHELWKRDFHGASGLMSIVLKPVDAAAVARMIDEMDLFSIGFSWGGYESLIVPQNPESHRRTVPWTAEGPLIRLHIGLEDVDDLIEDLEGGFTRLKAAP